MSDNRLQLISIITDNPFPSDHQFPLIPISIQLSINFEWLPAWSTALLVLWIWFDNVPHLKLVEYKKEQNWVKRFGDYLLFPGGGTQFKEGVSHYIQYIEKNLSKIAKIFNSSGVGMVIYEKPLSSACYKSSKENNPPLCDENIRLKTSCYTPLDGYIYTIPVTYTWPTPWPQRLKSKPLSLSTDPEAEQVFHMDTKHWSEVVTNICTGGLGVNWSFEECNGYERWLWQVCCSDLFGFLVNESDTLPVIFDTGLIGIYHDWCESLSTYPRTYDLLHPSFLFGNLTSRCDMLDIAVEMDSILRPGGVVIVEDSTETLKKLKHILRSLHWSTILHQERFLVGRKGFWRPETTR
ncbi:hypothetical protein R6Q57_027367 [Mikania cordata]